MIDGVLHDEGFEPASQQQTLLSTMKGGTVAEDLLKIDIDAGKHKNIKPH
jgi:hypothetical protein